MKALKEKRLSLRSFLRRGLVILSLFALAFASAACNSSGGDEGDTTGTGTTTPPPPRALSITIVSGKSATNDWFQGCEPDLTGIEIEVLWETGPDAQTIKKYTKAEFEELGFSASPAYCDEPGTPDGRAPGSAFSGEFHIVHIGSPNIQSEAIPYKGVIPVLTVTGGKVPKLYADEPPALRLKGTKITLGYMYEKATKANPDLPYTVPPPSSINPADAVPATKDIYMNSAYPLWDMNNIATGNDKDGYKVNVHIGKIKSGGTNLKSGTITVAEYMQVVGVAVQTPLPDDFWAYDDEIEIVNTTPSATTFPEELDTKLTDSNVKFNVTYQSGKAGSGSTKPTETQEKTWAEFKANVKYAHAVQNIDPNNSAKPINWGNNGFVKDGSTIKGAVVGVTPPFGWENSAIDILNYSEDITIEAGTYRGAATWTFWLEYVPKEYLLGAAGTDTAYVDRVYIDMPIATFQNEIEIKQRNSLPEALLPYHTGDTEMTDDWMNVINDRWVLMGKYQVGRTKLDKPVDWVSDYFYYGYKSAGNKITLDAPTLSGITVASFAVETERGFSLPVYYRGETQTQDDSVTVTIFLNGPSDH
jgi:hypothetical protein